MASGIYYIKNTINGKFYIGLSKDIEHRIREHISKINKRIHPNYHLQQSWYKYGSENFEIGIIEECIEEELENREIFWIAFYDSFGNGYNSTRGGWGVSGNTEKIGNKKWLTKNGIKKAETQIIKELRHWMGTGENYCQAKFGMSFLEVENLDKKNRKQKMIIDKINKKIKELNDTRGL